MLPYTNMEGVYGLITEFDNKTVLWVNPKENSYPLRRRFTIAHEIGHFCMHRQEDVYLRFIDDKETLDYYRAYWTRKESEANTFASALLVPTSLLIDIGSEIVDSYKGASIPFNEFCQEMTRCFQVSRTIMDFRLRGLGIGIKRFTHED